MAKRMDFDTNEFNVLKKVVDEGIETEESHQAYLNSDEHQQCFPLGAPYDDAVDPEVVDSITYEETLKRIRAKMEAEGGDT